MPLDTAASLTAAVPQATLRTQRPASIARATKPRRKDKLLRMPNVQERVPFSKQHIYNLIRAGDFPAPIALSRNTVVWLEREIDKWSRSASRRGRESLAAPTAFIGAGDLRRRAGLSASSPSPDQAA